MVKCECFVYLCDKLKISSQERLHARESKRDRVTGATVSIRRRDSSHVPILQDLEVGRAVMLASAWIYVEERQKDQRHGRDSKHVGCFNVGDLMGEIV